MSDAQPLDPMLTVDRFGKPTTRSHIIATPMKGIPIERRKYGSIANFRASLLYHYTARQAN